MTELHEPASAAGTAAAQKLGVIDVDVHTAGLGFLRTGLVKQYLPKRWLEHLELVGLRMGAFGGDRPRQREFAHRSDSVPPAGGYPGGDPDFAREQLLDRYDLSGAIMNDIPVVSGGKNHPDALAVAINRASNEHRRNDWFTADDRWYGSISVAPEAPAEAAAEIARCKEDAELGHRWVQVMLPPDNDRPIGNPRYWAIFEACEHFDLPVVFHVFANKRFTPVNSPNYYFEEHTDFALYNFPLVSSLVFEGVFERFPRLRVALTELAWSWAPTFAWRLDAAHRKLHREVPHLERKPSEVFAEHFWFSTQPMEEPDNAEAIDDVYAAFEQAGFAGKLMYSSDYPHWDFDAPDALWETLTLEKRREIVGGNASRLYGIELRPGTGLAVDTAGMPLAT